MKKSFAIAASLVLVALSGSAVADEQLEIGQKIYERAFGRVAVLAMISLQTHN